MNGSARWVGLSADRLRDAFDAGFAAPIRDRHDAREAFLGLTIGASAYAIRAREVLGLVVARRVVPIGSPIREMLGVAGIRGKLVPVYSLPALLGYVKEDTSSGWFVLCQSAHPVALAFANFNGYIEERSKRREAPGETTGAEAGRANEDGRGRPYVQEIVRGDNGVREVIGIGQLVEAIAALAKGTAGATVNGIVKEP